MPTVAWACDGSDQHAHAGVGMAPKYLKLPEHWVVQRGDLELEVVLGRLLGGLLRIVGQFVALFECAFAIERHVAVVDH